MFIFSNLSGIYSPSYIPWWGVSEGLFLCEEMLMHHCVFIVSQAEGSVSAPKRYDKPGVCASPLMMMNLPKKRGGHRRTAVRNKLKRRD
jgi:hypothetical protein